MNARIPDLTLTLIPLTLATVLATLLAVGCGHDHADHEMGHDPVAHEHAGDDHAGHEMGHDHADHDPTGQEPARETAARDARDAGDVVAHYTCSMHPSVKNVEPGTCPICSMALVPVFQSEIASGEVLFDEGRRQQIGITTARAELRSLAVSVRAVGSVTYDESRLTDVTLKVGGWIDELYANRLGQWVKEGEPLFTLYGPELFDAQQTYIEALETLENARKLRSPRSADLAIEMRRHRLLLSDLGPDQLERLEELRLPVERLPILAPASGHVIEKNVVAGTAVTPGRSLLRIAGLGRVWVEAEVYESELALLEVGAPATVTLPYLPGRSFSGRIAFVYPWLDEATRKGRVRIELGNPGLALKPEMYAEVLFERDLGERLSVPEEAILYAGDRRYVFLDLGEGRLRPQTVTLGRWAGDWVEILEGLEAGDEVVTSGNFLIAAEARLKLALDHWTPKMNGAEAAMPMSPAEDHGAQGDHGDHSGHGDEGHEGHEGHDDHGTRR